MERHLGRLLTDQEVVHHRNGDRADNRLANLQLEASQQEHIAKEWRSGHRQSKRYDPTTVARVRKAAANPESRQSDLIDISPVTVSRICRLFGIEWKRQNKSYISESTVQQALQGRTAQEAADHLGVCLQTLHNRWPHLLTKRFPPHGLDQHRDEVERLATAHGQAEAARRYGVCRQTVSAALKRWKAQDALQGEPASR